MDYQSAVAYIESIPKFTKKNSLSHTRYLLIKLKYPGVLRKITHVAGTNGKGSVCIYLRDILLGEKKSVGTFTSPHLVRINERFLIDKDEVSDEGFLEAFHEVYDTVKEMEAEGYEHPTYFEFLFVMAMVIFEKADVEYIVLETGLGGRLDATNSVIKPTLSIITSIGPDHQSILGETIEEIAGEKAGIIKRNVPLIFDGREKKSRKIIENAAKNASVPYEIVDDSSYQLMNIRGKVIDFLPSTGYDKNDVWSINVYGEYQIVNALLAIRAATLLLETQSYPDSFKETVKNTEIPGRMEEVVPNIFVDGAHNLQAVTEACKVLNQISEEAEALPVVLYSAVSDKDYRKIIPYICTHTKAKEYAVVGLTNSRGVSGKELAEVFHENTKEKIVVKENVQETIEYIKSESENRPVFCFGSLYLVGEIKAALGGKSNAKF